MYKKIIIEGLKEKDLDYLSVIKKMIADFGISIYQSKTKIFVKINYVGE